MARRPERLPELEERNAVRRSAANDAPVPSLGDRGESTQYDDLQPPLPPHQQRSTAPVYTPLMRAAALGDLGTLRELLGLGTENNGFPDGDDSSSSSSKFEGGGGGGGRRPRRTSLRAAAAAFDPSIDPTSPSFPGTTESPTAKPGAAACDDLFAKDKKGRTALDWARLGKHRACAELLEKAFVGDVERRRGEKERAEERARLQGMIARNARARKALLTCIDEARNSDVHLLLSSTEKIRDGVPPLTRGAYSKAARLLLPSKEARKKEIFWLDVESMVNGTVVVLACTCGDLPLLKKLVDQQHAIKLDRETTRGHTALTWCCVCGNLDAVTVLLDAGADLRMATKKAGRTALHMAAAAGSPSVVQCLLDRVYGVAVGERHAVATMDRKKMSTVEREGRERGWLKLFEEYTQRKDKLNGQTALDIAVAVVGGNQEVIELLKTAETRIALRQWQLQQLDAKGAPTACVQGCGFMGRADKIEDHEINSCAKRMVGCELCGQQLPFDQLEPHQFLQCAQRLQKCANWARGCPEVVEAEKLELHEGRTCKYRDVACRVPCDVVLQQRFLSDHEEHKCHNRTVPCPLGCGLFIRAISQRNHVSNDCVMRKVSCRVGCGAKDLAFSQREAHEKESCVRQCKWEGCGKRVGPLEVRQVHEKFLCPRRVVSCGLQCGVVGLAAEHLASHLEGQCPNRLVSCPTGCGKQLLQCEMEAHVEADTGDCAERLRRCPLDCVRVRGREGRRIEVEEAPGQYVFCSLRAYNRVEDAFKLTYPHTVKWERLRDLSYKFVDDASWVCGWVPQGGLDQHVDHECTLRSDPCPQKCGQTLFVGKMEVHLKACPRRLEQCPLGCGLEMEARLLEDHLAELCDQRDVMCPKCGEWGIKQRALPSHWREECTMLEVRCGLGCGERVARKHLQRHEESECGKRVATCSRCGQHHDLWQEELETHWLLECSRREVECLLGCGEVMEERFRAEHELQLCARRQEMCENCGASMMQTDLADHKVTACPGFLRACPSGCGQRVRTTDLERHQLHDCERRHALANAGGMATCPLGCGLEMTYKDQFQHVTLECNRRVADCPSGCGEMESAAKLGEHALMCPARVVPCGAGCPSCARALRSWTIPTVELQRGRYLHRANQLESLLEEQRAAYREASASLKAALEPEAPPFEEAMQAAKEAQDALEIEALGVKQKLLTLDEWVVEEKQQALSLELVRCFDHDSTALLSGVARNEVALVSNLIQSLRLSGVTQELVTKELDACDYVGNSALTKACEVGDVDMVQLLVREGASKDLETFTGKTPLVECAKFGSVECARFLIESGCEMDLVTKTKTTAFDWALNTGQARVLRHLVREYRVQKDLANLFRMVNAGDIKGVKKLVVDGEPYRQNLQHFIELEIADCDEEVEESETHMRLLREDLSVKEPQLAHYLAQEARELERVKALRLEASGHRNEGSEIVECMLKEYDESMLFLQSLSKTDLTEVTDVLDEKLAPPQARRICKAVATLLELKPKVVVDQRKARLFGNAKRQRAAAGKSLAELEQGELVEAAKAGGGVGSPAVSNAVSDYWGAVRTFLLDPNCISNLRFLNKSALDSARVAQVKRLAGKSGKGIEWTERHRTWKYGDEEEEEEGEERRGEGSSAKKKKKNAGGREAKRGHKSKSHNSIRSNKSSSGLDIMAEEVGEGAQRPGTGSISRQSSRRGEPSGWVGEGDFGASGRGGSDESLQVDTSSEGDDDEDDEDYDNGDASDNEDEGDEEEYGGIVDFESGTLLELQNSGAFGFLLPPPAVDSGGGGQGTQEQQSKLLDPERRWKLMEALSRWLRAVLAYYEASKIHAKLKERELFDEKRCEESLPQLEAAQYPVRIAKFAVGLVRRELDEHKRHVHYLNKKISGAEERMRVAKIFQAVAGTGHTLQSWCASVNQPDILELLFEHGAVSGFTDETQVLCATLIQLLWRNFWWQRHRGPFAPSLALAWRERSLSHQMACAAALLRLRHLRLRNRLPLVEAMYNGHHRILDVFAKKKIPMFQSARSWVKPLPSPPFVTPPTIPRPKTPEVEVVVTPAMILGEDADPDTLARAEEAHAEEAMAKALEKARKLSTLKSPKGVVDMFEAATQGAKERACDDYVSGVGWVSHSSEHSNWSVCLAKCGKHWTALAKHCEDGKKEAQRRRRLREATREQRELEERLERLLTDSTVMDWPAILAAIASGAACDFESSEGFTPLVRAAEEDTERLYYQPSLNADQQPVLAVELLLDRPSKRPQVDQENKHGYTALSWAGVKDRQAQMEALVKRGADVNFVSSKHHRTSLVWCAMVGKQRSVRFLLESGADQGIKDHTGRRALDWATEGEHAETLSVLLQFRQGNVGLVVKRRGAAIEQVPCCWGCGLITTRSALVEHEGNSCPKRSVKCRNEGCSVELLQAWEQVQHEAELCPQRSIDCPLGCGTRLRLVLMGKHVDSVCEMRTVDCEFGCGATMRLRDRATVHNVSECPNRLAECKLMCHSTLKHRDVRDHERNQCPCRIVGCRVGCGLTMMARVRDEHEEESCDNRVVSCRNRCKVEGLKARDLDAHERDLCARRLVPCPNKCPNLKIQFRSLASHEANKCSKRFVRCPEKCGQAVRFEDLANHVKLECERRLVDCPLGCGVHPRIQARMAEVHCRGECANRVVVCSMCGNGVAAAKLEGHKEVSCPQRVVECENRGCYKLTRFSEMPHHCDYECRKRQVFCLQGCGMAMYADKRKGHHEKSCPMRYIACPLGCAKPIRETEKAGHVARDCVRRAGAK